MASCAELARKLLNGDGLSGGKSHDKNEAATTSTVGITTSNATAPTVKIQHSVDPMLANANRSIAQRTKLNAVLSHTSGSPRAASFACNAPAETTPETNAGGTPGPGLVRCPANIMLDGLASSVGFSTSDCVSTFASPNALPRNA